MRVVPDGWALTWLREQPQDVGVAGSDYSEVPVIEGRDLGQAKAFGERYQSGVHAAEVLVGVLVGQFGNASPVGSCEALDEQLAVRH